MVISEHYFIIYLFVIGNDAIKCNLPDRFIEGVVTCKNSNGDASDVFGAQVHFGIIVVVDDVVTTVV